MANSGLWANELPPKGVDYVYCLRNPLEDYDIFYVGRTINLKERLAAHVFESRSNNENGKNKAKNKIIRNITSSGRELLMRQIDKTEIRCKYDRYLAAYKEIYWIRFYLRIGWNLVNVKDINADLSRTDFELYKKRIEKGESLSISDFYYGKDSNCDDVYDVQKILKFGYKIPETITPTETRYSVEYDYCDTETAYIRNSGYPTNWSSFDRIRHRKLGVYF